MAPPIPDLAKDDDLFDDVAYGLSGTLGAPDTGFSLILHYDPQMVAELAMGADPPEAIAERYGVEPYDFERLASQEWFARLVAQKRTEYHDTGMLFVAKAGMMAEALLTRLFQQSMAGSIPPPLTVEVAKQLTDIGRLKPQPLNTAPGAAGGGFAINIQVNGADVVKHDVPKLVSVSQPRSDLPVDASQRTPLPAPSVPDMPDGAARAPRAQPPTGVQGAGMEIAFGVPKGTPPAFVSNLKVPDFDVRHPGKIAADAVRGSAGAVPSLAGNPLPPGVGVR